MEGCASPRQPLKDGIRHVAKHAGETIGGDDESSVGDRLVRAYRQPKDIQLLSEEALVRGRQRHDCAWRQALLCVLGQHPTTAAALVVRRSLSKCGGLRIRLVVVPVRRRNATDRARGRPRPSAEHSQHIFFRRCVCVTCAWNIL